LHLLWIRSLAAESDAVAVLLKPFDEEPLLDAIARAFALSYDMDPPYKSN
jgi:hypothetical protein